MAPVKSCWYLYAVGYCTLLYAAFKVATYCRQLWRESLWSQTLDFKKYGGWAVVTGASGGIGKGIAFQLAKCGLNIVMIARTQSKLDKVALEMRETFGVEVKIVAIDFTSDDVIYDIIKDEIKDLDVGLLVNNVGLAWVNESTLLDVPFYEKYSTDAIRINVNTMMKMTEMVLPDMVKKNGGIIVNVASVVGKKVSPYYAIYGSTKSAIITYTKSMADEYNKKGVIFQCIVPAITATPMARPVLQKSNFFIPSGDLYGKYVTKAIGKSTYTNTAFFAHNLIQRILWMMPDVLYAKLLAATAERSMKKKS